MLTKELVVVNKMTVAIVDAIAYLSRFPDADPRIIKQLKESISEPARKK